MKLCKPLSCLHFQKTCLYLWKVCLCKSGQIPPGNGMSKSSENENNIGLISCGNFFEISFCLQLFIHYKQIETLLHNLCLMKLKTAITRWDYDYQSTVHTTLPSFNCIISPSILHNGQRSRLWLTNNFH